MLKRKFCACLSGYTDPNYGQPPTLTGDFTASIPAGFTFTRASIASRINESGNVVDYSVDAPRYIPGKGLLIESWAKNCCSNPRHTGAVVGTPGTPPTGWTIPVIGGCNSQIVSTGVQSGMEFFDLRLWATSTTTAAVTITIDGVTDNLACPNGDGHASNMDTLCSDVWYIKTVGTPNWGPLLTGNNFRLGHIETNSVGTAVVNAVSPFVTPPNSTDPLTSQIFSRRGNMNPACMYARPAILIANMGTGLSYDVTFRIGHIQCEVGTAAYTTPIRPATVSRVVGGITRSSDSLIMPALGSWYNSKYISVGVSWFDARLISFGGRSVPLVSFDDGTGSPVGTPYVYPQNFMQIMSNSGGGWYWQSVVTTAIEANLGGDNGWIYAAGSGPDAAVVSYQLGGPTNNYSANNQPGGYNSNNISLADPSRFTRMLVNEAPNMYTILGTPIAANIPRHLRSIRYYPRFLSPDECHDIAVAMAA
jgi:hypothetical protein